MKVRIFETGEIKELICFDLSYSVEDYTWDIIASYDKDNFDYDEEDDIYVVGQDLYEWWRGFFKQDKEAKLIMQSYLESLPEIDRDAGKALIYKTMDLVDLEDQPAVLRGAVEELKNKVITNDK